MFITCNSTEWAWQVIFWCWGRCTVSCRCPVSVCLPVCNGVAGITSHYLVNILKLKTFFWNNKLCGNVNTPQYRPLTAYNFYRTFDKTVTPNINQIKGLRRLSRTIENGKWWRQNYYTVSLTILVLIHLLIHFSTHLCHHPHSRHRSLRLSFTPGSKPTFSTNPSHRRFLLPTGLPHDNGTGLDLLRSSFYF